MFLVAAKTIIGLLLCCNVGIVQCLANLLYYFIWWLHWSATPRNYNLVEINLWKCDFPSDENNLGVFLAVAETIVGSLLCCVVGIVHCLFNLLCYVIWWWHPSPSARNYYLVGINLWKKNQNYLAQYQVISNDHAYVLIRWGLFWNNKSCFSITHRQWWSSNQLGKPSFCYLQYLFASFHWGEHFKNKEAEIVTVHNE